MKLVTSPLLPVDAGAVLIGEKYISSLGDPLERQGILPIAIPNDPFVDERLSGHADLAVLHTGGKNLYLAPYLKGSDLSTRVQELGFDIIFPKIQQGPLYPQDAALNLCIFGDMAIYDPRIVTDEISTRISSFRFISTRQGYTKCSVLPIDKNSIITADRQIGESAKKAGLEALIIRPGYITLPGFRYGFIGGSAFIPREKELAFTGSLSSHPDEKLILQFLADREIKVSYLTDRPIFDVGSIIPILEK